MGYRNYLYKIKKEDYVEGKDFFDYDDNLVTEIYELGKYVDFEVRDGLITLEENDCPDTECQIIDVKSILHIVSHYAKKHLNFLKAIKDGESRQFDNVEAYIDSQIRSWAKPEIFIYDLREDREKLVNSWEYQYEIFDLIRIYKTFDTENYYLLWIGY